MIISLIGSYPAKVPTVGLITNERPPPNTVDVHGTYVHIRYNMLGFDR
jgi:hypothetical protein